MSLIISF
jgi:hypothetical protein